MRIRDAMFWAAMCGALALMVLTTGCASVPTAAPEPRIVPVEAPRIVQVKCKDQRPPADTYPDTDDKLALIPDNDFESLAKAYRTGRNLRIVRELANDAQIAACSGN